MSPPYRPRLISTALSADLDTFPVVVLTGARQAGKRTLAQEGAAFADRPYLSLDDLSIRIDRGSEDASCSPVRRTCC